MPAAATKQQFSRTEALRLLGISGRQIKSWEQRGLVPPSENYDFHQLVALRTLVRLKAARLPVAKIQRALEAVRRKLGEVQNPLTELKIFSVGNRIRVQLGKQTLEPESGQLLLDFDDEELQRMVALPERAQAEREEESRKKKREAEQWFLRGVELETGGAPIDQAVDAYNVAVALDPTLAAALVNLGTIHFTAHVWDKAEKFYARAIEANPKYPLAHFNLGNLYDERGDLGKAADQYQAALKLDPNYGDAHYNLAVLYQSSGEPMKAAHHWRAYLKQDRSSPWAEVALRELEKLYASTLVRGRGKRREVVTD